MKGDHVRWGVSQATPMGWGGLQAITPEVTSGHMSHPYNVVSRKPPPLARVAVHTSLLPTSGMWPAHPIQQMRLAHKPPHLMGVAHTATPTSKGWHVHNV